MPGCTVKVSRILEGYIHNGPWEHCLCFIRATVDEDIARTIQGSTSLKVIDEEEKALFCGKVVRVTKPVRVFGDIEVTITAYSATIDLDMTAAVHTYQNKNLEEIAALICGEKGADFIVYSQAVKDSPKRYYLQSGETDWEFLNNLLREKNAALWADSSSLVPKVYLADLYSKDKEKELKKEIYFYNGAAYSFDMMKRGREITRSGETETLHEAAWAVYRDDSGRVTDEIADPAGWRLLFYQDPDIRVTYSKGRTTIVIPAQKKNKGFGAKTWKRNNCILIAFEGTSPTDWRDVFYDLNADEAGQLEQARDYVDKVLEMYPGAKLYISGHSLGGHLAMESALYLARTGREGMVARVEAFNALGLKTYFNKEDEKKLAGKVYRRDYQFDVVSETLPRFGEGTVYPDEEYQEKVKKYKQDDNLDDFFANPLLESSRRAFGPIGLKIKSAGVNHAISRFRHLYASKPSPYRFMDSGWKGSSVVVLEGKVTAVSKDRLKLSFEVDRGETTEGDAFNFVKSAGYSGMYMMPRVGDTVKVTFYKTVFNTEQVFDSAKCSSVNRKK